VSIQKSDFFDRPHRRYNPLTGDWILVSPHRTQRPWQGRREEPAAGSRKPYDETCYLCPGNARANGEKNPDYRETHVFTNDFAALRPDPDQAAPSMPLLLRSGPVSGTCRVICFSPRHDLTLPEMEDASVLRVVEAWTEQMRELGRKYRWVQIFENKGDIMGCSNPHPHGQVWAGDALPNEPSAEDFHQRSHFERNGEVLLNAVAKLESETGERIVAENPHWIAVVPFWAVWPFEILLTPRAQRLRLTDLDGDERRSLARILKVILVKYDNLFETSFPYTMGWHGAPTDDGAYPHWQLHAHFYPPLLRSATVKKFMVGYELLAEAQRDITAEQAAGRLRALPNVHWKTNVRTDR
jgi:UDPglucose--hexose-1-phosphate uridylyltransferase